jgi:C4-dicarboxylate transporter/malic acid transport protein
VSTAAGGHGSHGSRPRAAPRGAGARLGALLARLAPAHAIEQPREMIRQFTPNWFASTMGTGILALAMPQVPVFGPALRGVGEGLWLFNIGLFLLYSGLYAARWMLFWQEAKRIFSHNVVSMFMGTIPMGLATIINGFLVFGRPRWGEAMVGLADVLWWIDVALSLACGALLPYFMFTRQEHRMDQMTAVWLLPIVAAEVAAASGGLLVPCLPPGSEQLAVLLASFVLWAFSVPVALGIITILFLRMALHKLPPDSMAASSWLPLGPLGTAALGMLLLGTDSPAVLGAHGLEGPGAVASGAGLIAGLLFWGAGLWWVLLASLITFRHFRAGIPFNLGWWGYTFPLGVYTVATFRLGALLHADFFAIFGTVLFAVLAVMWTFVTALTVHGGWKGHLFVSPCIAKVN